MKPSALALVALVALAGLGVLLFTRLESSPPRSVPAPAATGQREQNRLSQELAQPDPTGTPDTASAHAPEAEATAQAPTRTAATHQTDHPHEFHGLLEVLDSAGQLLPPQTGTLRLGAAWTAPMIRVPGGIPITLDAGHTTKTFDFEVIDGRFMIPWNDRYSSYRPLRFDNESLLALPVENAPAASDAPGEASQIVRLQAVADSTLHVVSARTGQDLAEVEVHVLRRRGALFMCKPDGNENGTETELLHAGAQSPVRISGRRAQPPGRIQDAFALLVGAPGHAWECLSLPFPAPATTTFELQPVGTLELSLVGPVAELRPSLTLSDPSRRTLLHQEERFTEPSIRIEGLRSGGVHAYLNHTPEGGSTVRLATGDFVIHPGQVTLASLEFEAQAPKPRVRLSGRFQIPTSWPRPSPELTLQASSPPPDGRKARFQSPILLAEHPVQGNWVGEFEFEDVHPGSYHLAFPSLGWGEELEVPDGGSSEHLFQLPPRREIQLEFVDADSGERASEITAALFTGAPPPLHRGTSDLSLYAPDGIGRVDAPEGRVTVRLTGRVSTPKETEITVSSNDELHRIGLNLPASIALTFELNGTPVLRPSDLQVQVYDGSGEPLDVGTSWGSLDYSLFLRRDRRYEVRITRPNGYEAIEPFTVDTGQQPRLERAIQLVPLR